MTIILYSRKCRCAWQSCRPFRRITTCTSGSMESLRQPVNPQSWMPVRRIPLLPVWTFYWRCFWPAKVWFSHCLLASSLPPPAQSQQVHSCPLSLLVCSTYNYLSLDANRPALGSIAQFISWWWHKWWLCIGWFASDRPSSPVALHSRYLAVCSSYDTSPSQKGASGCRISRCFRSTTTNKDS